MKTLAYLTISLLGTAMLAASACATTSVPNIAQLRIVPSAYHTVLLLGYHGSGDGGGGTFTWNATSTAPDDCGTVIKSNSASTGRWIRSWTGAANLKWWGAYGDGKSHLLSTDISNKMIPSLAAVQAIAPTVASASWDSDTVAVELAKAVVPQNGTVSVPAGTYICSFQSWNLGGRSHITWTGAGSAVTKFYSTWDTTRMGLLNIGMLFAPYDMSGWQMLANQVYPQNDAKVVGTNTMTLKSGIPSTGLYVGDVVFWQDGRTDFQQNFGEFNQITAINGTTITFRYPWNRDYTTPVCEYGGVVTGGPYQAPVPGAYVTLSVNFGTQPAPTPGDAISLDNDVYTYIGPGVGTGKYVFQNAGRANTMSSIPAGTTVSGVCGLIRCTQATTDITMNNLTIVGCWDAIQIANTVNLKFNNCAITMQRMTDTPAGGLFFDGDGGREIDFTNCTFTAPACWASQWGRSTSGVRYTSCTFNNVAMDYSEYVNDCNMTNCVMTVNGANPVGPTCAIGVGMTCGGITISGCDINVSNMKDGVFENGDIQQFVHYHGNPVNIQNNTIYSTNSGGVFAKTYGFSNRPTNITGNNITGKFLALGQIGQVADTVRTPLGSVLCQFTGNTVNASFDYLLTSAGTCDNLIFENNTITKMGPYQGWPGGTIFWDAGTGPWPAKNQLWMMNNTFNNWAFNSNIYNLFNLYCPWGGGMQVTNNNFMNTSNTTTHNFSLSLKSTGTYATGSVGSGTGT
jgi:hypothetical protein